MRTVVTFLVVSGLAFGVARLAAAQGLHDVHYGQGVPCAACHVGEDVPAKTPANDACVTCHGTMIEPLEAGEEVNQPDPHRSPHLGPGEVPDCTSCHSVHGQSASACVMCHRSFEFDMNRFGSTKKTRRRFDRKNEGAKQTGEDQGHEDF